MRSKMTEPRREDMPLTDRGGKPAALAETTRIWMAASNRVRFAALLKFFQLEACFPQTSIGRTYVAVEFIAKQVKVAPEQFERYQWIYFDGRCTKLHLNRLWKPSNFHVLSASWWLFHFGPG
jgi:hypothetical protein